MIDIQTLPKPTGKIKSLAVLTSGGDAPGMNAAIRAVVRYAISQGVEVYGILRGYSGLLEGEFEKMVESSVANIIQRGGTILKTSRCEAFFKKSVRREAAHILRRKNIDGLVVIGGDGSFAGGYLLQKENKYPVVGIPGTIDNDIWGTDDTIGFDTAVNTALEAIDRIRDTASSHDRLFLIEVMGRSSGMIAMEVGIGGGAETIIVPERDEGVATISDRIRKSEMRGKKSSIIVVAEGPKAASTMDLAKELKKQGFHPKVCILGHTQRGGTPTAHDRLLATLLGATAVAYLLAEKSNCMIGVQRSQVTAVSLAKIMGKKKKLPDAILKLSDSISI